MDELERRHIADWFSRWSSKFGEFPAGDPELHHVAGTLYAEGTGHYPRLFPLLLTNTVFSPDGDALDAELHLTLGTSDSPSTFCDLEYTWYLSDEPSTAPLYVARAVFPYLMIGNLRSANKVFLLFTTRLASSNPGLGFQDTSSASSDLRICPSLPLLNFLGLLLLAIQRGAPEMFRQLKSRYAGHIQEVGVWDDALAQIGEMYFGIRIPSQSNPLFDMMGSLFGGAGGAAGGQRNKAVGAAPSAPGLD